MSDAAKLIGQTDIATLKSRIGQEIGVSRWHGIDQARIDAFAAITDDEQFIHCDPVAASRSQYGGTIAHGFLVLSLLSRMSYDALPVLEGQVMSVNYGFDRIRFLAPVRSGARVRGRFTLIDVAERGATDIAARYKVNIEAEGSDKPSVVAEWTILTILA